MSAINVNDFLNSLAIYVVGALAAQTPALAVNYLALPRGLWIHRINWPDDKTPLATPPADPVSVLRIYGGPSNINESKPTRSIQCMTTTIRSESAAMQQAEAILETLLEPLSATGVPLRPLNGLIIPNWKYPAQATQDGNWKIVSLKIEQPPGKVGLDPVTGRPLIVFNFEAGFVPVGQ